VRILTVMVVLCALAFSPGAIAAGDDGAEMKARTHFAAGEYKEALEIYARLYAETMHPTYLRNIARCHQNLGNPDKAISSFREYLRKAHDLTPDQRKEIEGYIAEMEHLKQSKEKSAEPAAAPPPAAPAAEPPAETTPPLVGPPTVTATGTTGDDGGAFYTRAWFWGVVAGLAAAGVVTFLWLRDSGPESGNLGALDLR